MMEKAITPKFKADLYNCSALMCANRLEFADAVVQLRSALVYCPDDIVMRYNMAYCQYKIKSYMNALTNLEFLNKTANIP